MCDYSFKATVDPSVADGVSQYFSKNLKGLLSSDCLRSDGLKFTQYININDPGLISAFDEIGVFLDGFSFYDNFLRQIPADSYNNNILKISEIWEEYRVGQKLNFPNTSGKFFIF